jgi:LytS/YehU family sensor histidine kinase
VKWFYILNVLLLVGYNLYRFIPRGPLEVPEEVVNQIGMRNIWAFFLGGIIAAVFFQVLMILLAVGLRHLMRMNDREMQFEEERRKTAEAELTWLKHQLNPHFLFNTLNNISSLTQIDPDKAQESIGQLSDLLRYALYDSEAEKVQLASEIEFMDNYIDLMALRCNELTTVEKHLEAPSKPVEVAPLLFISLVENAFKHGVNARYPSFVRIAMRVDGDSLVFTSDNSRFEKQGTDRIGSGIGLENMKRRLELLYPGRYTYEQTVSEDAYHVKVTLKIL